VVEARRRFVDDLIDDVRIDAVELKREALDNEVEVVRQIDVGPRPRAPEPEPELPYMLRSLDA